jgi:hypothetical protein
MKRRWLATGLCLMLLLVSALAPCPVAAAGNLDDVIPDEKLRAAIRDKLNQPYGDLFVIDLQSITSMDVSDRGISDITGLEYCTNLSRIDLSNNSIVNLDALALMHDPLAGTKLRDVNLANNQISDITPLRELNQIKILNLSGNRIRDLSVFRRDSGSYRVQVLDLSDNGISDLSPLGSLTDISLLMLADNLISDISPLMKVRGLALGDSVDLYGNPLDETSINEIIPALRSKWIKVYWGDLTIEAPPVEVDLPAPEVASLPVHLEALVRRTLDRPQGDILVDEVARFSALDLSGIGIDRLTGLDSFVNLRHLYLSDNRLEDISPLLALSKLAVVDLMGNPLGETALTQVIPDLKTRGVTVLFEAPEPPDEKPVEPPVTTEPPLVIPPTAPPDPVTPPPDTGGSRTGVAIGGLLGGLIVIGVGVFWWSRRRSRGRIKDGPGYTYRR